MAQPQLTPQRKKKHSIGRRIRRIVLLLLLVYAIVAVLPYAFPPKAQLAENWLENALSDANVDSATMLETGSEALDMRLRLIAGAQSSIQAGSYIYAMDESGTQVTAALLAAADRGVRVQLIIDGLIGFVNLKLDPAAYALGSHPNVEIRFYNPVNLLDPMGLNARYHEKFFVVDDEWLILGGRNVADEFLSQEGNPNYNYDRDILLHHDREGRGACQQVAEYFAAMWTSTLCAARYESVPGLLAGKVSAAADRLREMWAQIQQTRDLTLPDFSAFAPVDKTALLSGDISARPKAPLVYAKMLDLMGSAKTRVILESPYFVMDAPMRDALSQLCALDTDVTLITNSAASGNNIIASADGVFHRGMTNRMDARVLEQQSAYSMHTKSILIDDCLSVFGSFNVDPRSAYIDTELMLAVYSKPLAAQLENGMDALIAQSSPVNEQAEAVYASAPQSVMPFLKGLTIYVLSPFVSLFRFLA